MINRAQTIKDPNTLAALAHPIRRQMLDGLREPVTAAGLARKLGLPRQQANYHLKSLEKAELVKPAGERRKGHLIEKLYEAVAGTLVLSPEVAWDSSDRQRALNDQVALNHLVKLGNQIQRDASGLLDRAAFDGDEISSASVEAEVSFTDEAARTAFMEEYLKLLGPLLDKHGAQSGLPYRVAVAIYPDPEQEP